VKTYQVTSELAGFSRKRKVLRGLLMGGLLAATDMMLGALWPYWTSSGHPLENIIGAVISGIIFGFVSVALIKRNLNYRVVVSDDYITAVYPRYKRSVRKNEVKTVAESDGNVLTAPSLRISKYGPFGTWFWGGIWIPRALPEYEYVRNLALSWKGRSQA
jgi:hypothetical protein